MPNTLIAYSTTDGQTKKVADYLSNKIEGGVVVKKIEDVDSFDDFDKIIIGSSVRYGKFSKKLYKFVKQNNQTLKDKQADFYGINLIARNPEKRQIETNVYVRKFLEKIQFQPHDVNIFAGALNYTQYSLFDKKMIQLIMKITKGPTDTSVDREFTDWEQVATYAEKVNQSFNNK